MHRISLKLAALATLLPFSAHSAHAASSVISIVINGPPSVSINCPVAYPSGASAFTTPVPAATVVATCAVTPTGWSGVLALSGPDAGFFAPSGMNLVVGSAPITAARTYSLTVTATP
jgi:hypothetical protein